ncbi:MAG TPA: GFA family protein [Hyphomonadaceae bacterium]|jgi:hypothetical protein|nr:GFA family protein [Hyphomonadaceae bacterium]
MTIHSGSCHCGAVKYEADVDLAQPVMSCNCSHCSRKGFLLTFIAPEKFDLKTPDAPLSEYKFNKHNIAHLFCPTCGVEAFARGTRPDGQSRIAVNVRCLPDVDIETLKVQKVDGKNF